METHLIVVLLALTAVVLPYANKWFRGSRSKRLHRRNIKKADDLKAMFRKWDKAGIEKRVLSYLRKIDPLVFEDLVLSCLLDVGAKIHRNKRYTGDGGVDGVFYLNGRRYYMQAKRYSSAINPQHMMDFIRKCNGTPGIFVHTGRTGSKTYAHMGQNLNIKVISGDRLARLVLNGSVPDIL